MCFCLDNILFNCFLSKGKGCHSDMLMENTVKITNGSESAGKGNIGDRLFAFGKQIFCIVDTVLIYIASQINSGTVPEYTGKIMRLITEILCYTVESDILFEMVCDVVKHLMQDVIIGLASLN